MSALAITDKERATLIRLAEFPLLARIYGRRSRRFPVGGEIPGGRLAFRSGKDVQPLSELERALVLATVTGITGWHFGISHHQSILTRWSRFRVQPFTRPTINRAVTRSFFLLDLTAV